MKKRIGSINVIEYEIKVLKGTKGKNKWRRTP